MKAFIDRIFKAKALKEETVQDQATEEAVEAIAPKTKENLKHIDCECAECIKKITKNAK
jgi:hypothetical protein